MHGRSSGRWLIAAVILVAACVAGDKPAPLGPPTTLISDGAHSGGTPGFYFLPPMVSNPVTSGVFDADIATVNPAILICDATDDEDPGCGGATPVLRSFTVSSIPPIVLEGDKYKVNWNTKEGVFTAGRTYRLYVLGGTGANRRVLGFADVLLTTEPGKAKNLANGQIIVLNDGRTLPIHIRIEVGVVLAPGPAQSFQLTELPPAVVAGTLTSLTVTARDGNGLVATGYRGTVTFSSSDPQAVLPSPYTFTAADAGAHSFSGIALKTAGAATVGVADPAFAAEASVLVQPASAARLELTGLPDAATAGATHSVTVTARDEFGNIATGYAGTIAFTSSDPAAILPDQYGFTAADAGVHAFPGVALLTAGAQTVTATDTDIAAITGSASVSITPGAATLLVVSGLADAVAGTAQSVTVTARDASGNVATGYTGTIAFSATDFQADLPAEYTFGAGDGGTRTFVDGVTLKTAGPVTVTATDQAIAALSGAQTVSVAPAAAAALVLSGVPDPAIAGTAYDLTVTARDAFGNTAAGYAATVQFSASDPAATVPAAYPFQSADAGVRTFAAGVMFETAGPASLQATDGTLSADLSTTVEPGAATALRFTMQPSDALAGEPIDPPVAVTAYDAFDNIATGFTGPVSIAIGTNPTGGVLSGTTTRAAVLGIATFGDLEIDKAGVGYTLVASASGVTSATSDAFETIAPAPAEVRWVNAVSGSWSDGTKWSTGVAPTAGQAVFIDVAGTYTVTLDVNATINSLTLGAASGVQTLAAGTGRVLALTSSSTILSTGRIALTNATINGPGILTNAGTISLSQGSTINAALVNAGTLASSVPSFSSFNTINGPFTTLAGSLVRVQAGASNTATLTVANGFTNHGTIELTKAGDAIGATTLAVTSGTLVNAPDGTIRSALGSGGGRVLTAQLDNQGTLTLDHVLEINRGSADHSNSGLISVSNGNLTLSQNGTTPSFTNTGTITVAAGRTWAISFGAFTHAAGATLDGGGALALTSVNPAAFGSGFTLGALSLNQSTANFATDVSTATMSLSLVNATINGPGTLTNAAGRTISLSHGSTINAPLVNAGTLASGVPPFFSVNTINGAFTTLAGSLVRVQAGASNTATLTVANGFTNHGTIELTKAGDNIGATTLTVTTGTLVNAPDGTIRSALGSGGGRTLNAQLDNQGTLSVPHVLTISRSNAQHLSSGSIVVSGVDLTIAQSGASPSLTNTGLIDVVGAGVMRVNGGTFTNGVGGAIQGSGTFETSSTTSFTNAGSVTATLVRIGNTLAGSGSFAPLTAEFFGSAASIPVASTFAYTHVRVLSSAAFAGSKVIPGNLTVAATGNLTIGGHEIVVEGTFATTNTAVLTMQNALGVLNARGNASFGGGSTNGRLTAGTLRLGGTFTQSGSTAAFAASTNHVTELDGAGEQTVFFTNPGAATTASHFQHLTVVNFAGSVVLTSATFANGQLRTGPLQARTIRSAGLTLTAAGLSAAGLVLDGTLLRIVNGAAITQFDNATFRNMNPTITQFRLDRLNDVVTFNNTTFETVPTTGLYLHLVDTDGGGAVLFRVTMLGTTPPNHGGKVSESVPGQLLGWPF